MTRRSMRAGATAAAASGRSSTDTDFDGHDNGDETHSQTADDEGGGDGDHLPTLSGPSARQLAPLLRYDGIPPELGEAIRRIVNRAELRTGRPLPQSVAVTSALLGEGVTTVSQSMATLVAQENNSFVCWVDCGWLADDDEQAGEDDDAPNLIDLLSDQSRIVSAFRSSPDLPQLVSLSPGRVPASKRNMIVRSPEFERLLNVLSDEFDHVIFDIPPVLSNANALALLRRADASLIVARHRATSIAQIQRAIEATEPTPNLGVVLNRFRTRIPQRLRRLMGD